MQMTDPKTLPAPVAIVPSTGGDTSQLALLGRGLFNEAFKNLLLLWGHPVNLLLLLLTTPPIYLVFQFIVGDGQIDRALVPPTLLAFLFFPILYVATFVVVGDVLEEVNTGTFGQVHLGPVSPALLLVGRLVPLLLFGILLALLTLAETALVLGVGLPLSVPALLPMALTVLDIAGFAVLICGLALVLPQIGGILHLFSGIVFVLNGTIFPVALWPGWVQVIARVVPTTLGIEATQQVVLQGQSLAEVWTSGLLPFVTVHAVGLMLSGMLVFVASDRRAMRRGTLG
jgi:ABC-type polysaccharide/polyol phosphate export permease